MEYTQWDIWIADSVPQLCLNPCCNGIYSMSEYYNIYDRDYKS